MRSAKFIATGLVASVLIAVTTIAKSSSEKPALPLKKAQQSSEELVVYRCPGPPILYSDAMSPAEAKAKGCRRTGGDPVAVLAVKASGATNWDAIDRQLNTPTPPKPKRELGPMDSLRYDNCREKATQAPTAVGVTAGLKLCDERFGQ